MAKKKENDIVIESGIKMVYGLSASSPVRGETINLITIDDAGYFNNSKKEIEIKPKSLRPDTRLTVEQKRRLKLLK